MPTITQSDIADIGNTTLATMDKLKFTELATSDEEHHFLPQFIHGKSVKVEGGKEIEFDIMTDESGTARNIGYFDKDQHSVRDVMVKATVPWRRTVAPFDLDVLEIAQNKGDKNKIQDLIGIRRASSFMSMSNLMETDGWGKPSSSSDDVTPFGIRYWCIKDTTETTSDNASTGGFNGGDPDGFTGGCAGVTVAAVPRWNNWTQEYVNVTDDDLVDKMRTAAHHITFKSPIKGKYNENTRGPDKYVYYLPYTVLRTLEKLAEKKNSSLGKDLAPYDGETSFLRNPMRAVSKLDDDTDNPIYMINWSVFYLVVMRGMGLTVTPFKPVAGMSEVVSAKIRVVWNTKCVNRRRLAVLSLTDNNT